MSNTTHDLEGKAVGSGQYEPMDSNQLTLSHKRNIRLSFMGLILIACSFLGGKDCCPSIIPEDPIERAIAVLGDAIDALDRNSSAWQSVLQELISKLTEEAQSTIRNEVSNLLDKGVAAIGAEFRCNVDFIGRRVSQALFRIRAKLLGQTIPPVEPALCKVVPPAIDMSLPPNRRSRLEFFGYDFDMASITVLHEQNSGQTDATRYLDQTTHYHMTLNLGGNGVPLSNNSNRIILKWNGKVISTVAVVQPQTPICRTKPATYSRNAPLSFTPPHTRGDKEFKGHGPKVACTVSWHNHGEYVDVRIYMKAKETKKDWTTAEGSKTARYYTPPHGWRVERITSGTTTRAEYVDTDHSEDHVGGGPGGPAKRFVFRGDHKGKDAGSYTGVDVVFNPLEVQLVEYKNCVPPSAIRVLEKRKWASEKTLLRLKSLQSSDKRESDTNRIEDQ